MHDDGRAFLAYYERGGALVGVVGAGVPDGVRRARADVAAGTPISDMLRRSIAGDAVAAGPR